MKRSLKTFTDTDGKKYRFNAVTFNRLFKDKQKQYKDEGKSEFLLRQDMSAKLGVSPDTIKSWRYMYNGPADLDLVRSIADFFSVEYSELLYEPEDENMNTSTVVSTNQAITNAASSFSIEDENAAAENLYKKLLEIISTFCEYYNYAWADSDEIIDENSSSIVHGNLSKEQVAQAIKLHNDHITHRDKYVAQCLDLYDKTKDLIISYSFKVSMKTIKSCYKLLDEIVNDIFFKNDEDYEPVQYEEADVLSSWGRALDYGQADAFCGDISGTYYSELFDAFSEYPKR